MADVILQLDLVDVYGKPLGEKVDNPTHPYNIHEILVAHQKIDPGYTFQI